MIRSERLNVLCIAALLIIINIVAHFMPFERASLAPDDYSNLISSKYISVSQIPFKMPQFPDRPLNYAFLMFQHKLIGDNSTGGLLLVLLSSTAVLLAAFFLLRALLDDFSAFIGSVVFCLLPNKLAIYHSSIFVNINTAIFVYTLSLLFFIKYVKGSNGIYFIISLFTYLVGIFWYEVGFFTPIIMFTYCCFYKKDKIRAVFPFIVLSFIYAIYRLTNAFGLGRLGLLSHSVSFSMIPSNFIDLLHHYFGRYIIRNIIYGFYKFTSIDSFWMIVIIVSNILFLTAIGIWIKRQQLKRVDNRLLILAAIIFILFLAPSLLNNVGGIGGRHLVLPSLAITLFIIWLLEKAKNKWRAFFLSFAAVALIISQGNAWTQVVACRINGAVYETIKEKREELSKADNIIIDTKSFADNIPFTLVERDFNVLNTYFGAQAFEDRGLISMVRLVVNDPRRTVYVATGRPIFKKDGLIYFAISKSEGYRSVSKKTVVLPQRGTVVIDFENVYGKDFNNGLRVKKNE